MTRLFREALAGRMPVCIKGGYDFVDVRDVADGVIAACTKGRVGETYLLTNRYIEISEILNTIAEKTGRRKVFLVPYALARLGVPLLELYYNLRKQTPLFTRYSLMTVRTNANFDHRKADTELGYHPRPLEESIRDTILWLQHHQE